MNTKSRRVSSRRRRLRERNRRIARKVLARAKREAQEMGSTERGKASNYIRWLDDLPPGQTVIHCRVSEREQRRQKNLDHQGASNSRSVKSRGFSVVAVVEEMASG